MHQEPNIEFYALYHNSQRSAYPQENFFLMLQYSRCNKSGGFVNIDGAASIASNLIYHRQFVIFIKSTVISHPNFGSKCEQLKTVQLLLNYVLKKTK